MSLVKTLLMFVIIVIVALTVRAYIIDWRAGLIMTIAFGIDKFIARKMEEE